MAILISALATDNKNRGFYMKDVKIKTYLYKCSCGYEVKVFLDSGIPQESCKCKSCGNTVNRKEC